MIVVAGHEAQFVRPNHLEVRRGKVRMARREVDRRALVDQRDLVQASPPIVCVHEGESVRAVRSPHEHALSHLDRARRVRCREVWRTGPACAAFTSAGGARSRALELATQGRLLTPPGDARGH